MKPLCCNVSEAYAGHTALQGEQRGSHKMWISRTDATAGAERESKALEQDFQVGKKERQIDPWQEC